MGCCGAGFGGVVGVVEADAHDFAECGRRAGRGGERGSEERKEVLAPLELGDKRQLVEVERAKSVEGRWGECVAGEVVDDASEAADVASRVEDAGLLLVGGAEAEEFHGGVVEVC